jgi:hypothetical protein
MTRIPACVLVTVCLAATAAPAHAAPVVLAAAGDIACAPGTATDDADCHQAQTSDEVIAAAPDAVAVLGDNQYEDASLPSYQQVFGPTWGRLGALVHPVPGNHEYSVPSAAGYFDYFDGVGAAAGQAGPRDRGYYSYDLGAWHVVALNSNCPGDTQASCQNLNYGRVSGEQVSWLRQDLAAHLGTCTAAYWHAPLYSSGFLGSSTGVRGLWDALMDYGADVVLNGHDHDYERFAPQTATGAASATGIREFVVGIGGKNFRPRGAVPAPNSQLFLTGFFGALFLSLDQTAYSWRLQGEDGVVRDTGTTPCSRSAPLLTRTASAIAASAARALRRQGAARLRRAGRTTLPFTGAVLGTLTVGATAGGTTIGQGATKVTRLGAARVVLKLTAAGRRTLARRGLRGLTVRATYASARGVTATGRSGS